MGTHSPRRLLSLGILLFTPLAFAAPPEPPSTPPPVVLSFAHDSGWRWRWGLRNVSSHPVELVADRRLISFDFPLTLRPRHARSRTGHCVHSARPRSNETLNIVRLNPGETYSELVDLRDTCNLRVPSSLGSAPVTIHYGFRPSRRLSSSRSITITSRDRAVPTVSTMAVVTPFQDPEAPSSSPALNTPLTLEASPANAASSRGLAVRVRLRNRGLRPLWVPFQPTRFSFLVTAPSGQRVLCNGITRDTYAQREIFARLGAQAQRSLVLLPELYCPPGSLDHAGLYTASPVFRNNDAGERFNLGQVFSGEITGSQTLWRISRGDGRLVPFSPRFDD